MYKFKVGDNVVVTDYIRNGQLGTVELVDCDDPEFPYKVRFSDEFEFDWYDETEIELYSLVSWDDVKVVVDQSNCNTDSSDGTVPMEIKHEGVKFDSDKLQWWYLWQFLPELEQVAYVLQYGDKKYPAEDGSNWKRLDNLERRASSAAMRHLSAYLQNNKQDNETNKSHLAHAITNLLFLMHKDRQNANPT